MDLDFLKDYGFILFYFIACDSLPAFNPDVVFNSDLHSAMIQRGHLSHFLRDEDKIQIPRAAFINLLAFPHPSSFLVVLGVHPPAPKFCLWRVNHIKTEEALKSV